MDIRVKASDYQMTPEVSKYLDEKIAQIETLIGAEADQSRVEADVGRATGHHKHSEYMYFAELQLLRPGWPRLVAKNHEPNVNSAIENAKEELLRQIRHEKKLHARVWRRGGALAKRLLRID